jgi:hypothetical protein
MRCQFCGRSPAQQFVVMQHTGMLLVGRTTTFRPVACRDHALEFIGKALRHSLIYGWWGAISLVIYNPFVLIRTMMARSKAASMPPPAPTPPPVAPPAAPPADAPR